MRRTSPLATLALVATASAGPALASPTTPRPATKVIRTVAQVGGIDVDGSLDEPAWAKAPPSGNFVQRSPSENAPATLPTEVRVVHGDHALYVGVRAHDPEARTIERQLARRDTPTQSDWILVGIDSYHDRRTAYVFGLNPAGVQRDQILYDDTLEDPSWDAVWAGAARVDEAGWTAEFRIPYSQLRFSGDPGQVWGFQVIRDVTRLGESVAWSSSPRSIAQLVSRFGELHGLPGIPSARRVELLPYASIGASLYRAVPGDPLHDGRDAVYRAGLDFKVGLGPSVTLAGTVNPDFGQVEADPSQVNLGAGELFLAEKRPFFLEGTDIFRFALAASGAGDEQLFYSRRIGAAPHGFALTDGSVDTPEVTTIYGAAKLSGKSGGWSFGVLDAVTGEEHARYTLADNPSSRSVLVEPLTNFMVARLRKDLREGRTSVGAAVTAVNRRDDASALRDVLHDQAYAGGLELSHRFGDEGYQVNARVEGSWVHGSPAAILATQLGPVHRFQRPDADHIESDPDRTSLAGEAAQLSLAKITGDTRWMTELDTRSPGFEINDLGFQPTSDLIFHSVWLEQRDDEPDSLVRNERVSYAAWHVWNYGGELLSVGGNVLAAAELSNHWGGAVVAGFVAPRLDASALRGGPGVRHSPFFVWNAELYTDQRRALSAMLQLGGYVVPENGATSIRATPSVTWRVATNAELTLMPSIHVGTEDVQYVDQVRDRESDLRYIIARIRQKTAALTVRGSYTVSPRLSLQLYAQPFVTTGRFDRYREAVRPSAADVDDRYDSLENAGLSEGPGGELAVDDDGDGAADFAFRRADFDFRQLRASAVLRWEYLPGSAFFLIWSHDRTSVADDGQFSLSDELDALGDEPGEHLVMAKLSYWFGL